MFGATSGTRGRQALAFWEQAEDFYWAADDSRPSARPLLYYYSFMNIVKAFLIHRGRALKATQVHGIRHARPSGQATQLQTQELVVSLGSQARASIYADFASELNHQFNDEEVIKLRDVVQQIVGIHRAWTSVTGDSGSFAAAEVSLRKIHDQQRLFAAVSFSNKDKQLAENIAQRAGWVRVSARDDSIVLFETTDVPIKGNSYRPSTATLAKALGATGMHLLLTERDGYRIYFSDLEARESARVPQLLSMYALMFFLGSITRYRPYDFDRYVAGKWGWLVNEFISSQPAQFVYLMLSEIVGKEVVVPLGRIGLASI